VRRKSMIAMNLSACINTLSRFPNLLNRPRISLALLLICYCVLPINAMAQNAAASSATASGASMLQVMLGLGLVLAVMAGCAWLLRRFGGLQRGAGGAIKIIGGSAVGQRERVVLVEVADTWLVIGVAPGHVTALHSMPKGEITVNTASAPPTMGGAGTDTRFSAWFRQVMAKRDGEQHG
jgi:flagellar protein FliO/FliZ